MNIRQAIQTSANVIRITNIKAGDVYKRFENGIDDSIYYGIVRNVHNDGETPVVEATEYRQRYGDIEINLKVLRGAGDYTLFPADPEELAVDFETVITRKEKEIDRKEAEILKLRKEIAEVERLASGAATKDLQAMSYMELSQSEYEAKKLAAGI